LEWSEALQTIIENCNLMAVETAAVFDDIDTPSALVHCEMRLRKMRREAVVNRPVYPSNSESFTTFDYIIDTPVKTDIVVGRGFVKDPSKLQIIRDQSASSPIFVFTDETVAEIYGYDFKKKLVEFGYDVNLIVLPVGEESKSLTNYAYLVERVLRKGVDEQSVFISLGGGVVCNVCGFVASSIYRGLNLVHLPTTLMAQSDAAVSHKQGINGYQGKNLVGSYYSPQMVAIDVETLNTLPLRLVADGMAEVIKHAIGQDESYVDMLLAHNGDLRDLDFIEAAIRRNVQLKCELVLNDPKEHKDAMILQYGHTVGHPVEHLTGYSYYHGESVAVGMSVAARISHIMGGCSADLIKLQDEINDKYKLPSRIPAYIKPDSILETMRYNKKFLSGGTRMALLQGVGKLWSVNDDYAIPVSDKVLLEAVEASMEK
jgi:3-dehydroquinate synthase